MKKINGLLALLAIALTGCAEKQLIEVVEIDVKSQASHHAHEYLESTETILKNELPESITLKRVNEEIITLTMQADESFQTGKWTLERKYRDDLISLAKVLSKYPNTKIKIKGHTDTDADKKTNIEIGKKRAEAVARELIKNQVNEKRIEIVSEFFEVPICSNKTKKGKTCNRRVEIDLYVRG